MWDNNKSNGSTELTAHLKPGEPRNLGCDRKVANGEPNTGIPCQAFNNFQHSTERGLIWITT